MGIVPYKGLLEVALSLYLVFTVNPDVPVQVYHPCVLLTKKRYVGFMYEAPRQAAGVFDAKGIETVRRDTCSAVAKMLERSLRILFTSKDVSQVQHCSNLATHLCVH